MKVMATSQITSRFGASVRSLRHRMGISQEELAERADLHRTYITGIEGGTRNITLRSIEKLASALQVTTESLLLHADENGRPAELSGGKYADILMVEDNRDDVELALQAFKRARIINSVQVVYDGKEALNYLFCEGRFAGRQPEDQPQLVLLDLDLPKVGGLEVLRRLKAGKLTRLIPVVILTISRDACDISECRRLGAESYLIKPVNFLRLSQATSQLNLGWALLKSPLKPSESGALRL
jgi:CheY-like chemotaxis protein/DNA-binding XRE family transcriptional regulator